MAVQLLPEHGHVVIARMVQPEMGRAAPQLDLLHAQPLLAVQEIVQGEAPVMLVHIDQLTAPDTAHSLSPPLSARKACRTGWEGFSM